MNEFINEETNYYLPSFFTIYMNSSKSLENLFGSEEEHCLFHEYIHYLEDILTTYGVTHASQAFNNVKALYHHVKNKEKELDTVLTADEDTDKVSDLNKRLFNLYLQYTPETTELSYSDSVVKITPETTQVEFPDKTLKDVTSYKVFFQSGINIQFGEQAIMESISHILEKLIYSISTKDYLLPYDLAYLIWIYYLPEESENYSALLDLEEFSLQFYNPADIFIMSLEKVKNGEIDISSGLYKRLLEIWHSKDKNASELYQAGLAQLESDINGVFVADVYSVFKTWILQVLKNAGKFKEDNDPIFSLILQGYDKTSIHELFKYFKECFGMPMVINANGAVYIRGILKDGLPDVKLTKENIGPWMFAFYSFISVLAVYSVYKNVIKGDEKTPKCLLTEVCRHYNEYTNDGISLFDFDDDCIDKPEEKRVKEASFCPFAVVWQTFGLNNMYFFR